MTSPKNEKGGLKAALEHGYRRMTVSKKRCENCDHSTERTRDRVFCTMFDFWAVGRGTCAEWAGVEP